MIGSIAARRYSRLLSWLFALLAWLVASAARADVLLPEPNLVVRNYASVNVAAVQADGRIIVGGSFDFFNDKSASGLVRIAADGTLDPAFVPGSTDGSVYSLAIAGPWVYVGGTFDRIGGIAKPRLARINLATGAVDAAWTMTPSLSGFVYGMASDGTYLYVSGSFTSLGGQARAGVARIVLATGALDPGWAPAMTSTSQYPTVFATDGSSVWMGGRFTSVSGSPRTNLAKVSVANGTVDNNFHPDPNSTVYGLALANGGLYVGGAFDSAGGSGKYLARLAPATGAADPAFVPAAGFAVLDVLVSGGRLYAGGSMTDMGGQPVHSLAALDPLTGALLATPAEAIGTNVVGLRMTAGGLLAYGSFNGTGPLLLRGIAVFDSTTLKRRPTEYGVSAMATVLALQPLPDGTVVVGGSFVEINGKTRRGLALLNPDGSLNTGWAVHVDGFVRAFALDAGYLYVAGVFSVPSLQLARIRLGSQQLEAFADVGNGTLASIATAGNWLYLGGSFNYANGPASRLARIDRTSRALDTTWAPAPDAFVNAIAMSGADVIATGNFQNIGGQQRTGVAKVMGATGQASSAFNSLLGLNSSSVPTASSVAVGPDGIYIGGNFTLANGATHQGIVRVDPDFGRQYSAFTAQLSAVPASISVLPNGIFVGNNATTVGNQSAPGLVRLDPVTGLVDASLGGITRVGGTVPGQLWSAVATPGKTWFGGIFDAFSTRARTALAAWGPLNLQQITVYEFYAPSLNHYFRTANAEEAAALKANPSLGFNATGNDFRAFHRSAYPTDAKPVCRFYGSIAPGPNSHFYTVDTDECAAVKGLQYTQPGDQPRWNYEEIAFAIYTPLTATSCPPAAPIKVYRAYNNRAAQGDSNHRLTTDTNTYNQMIAQGWSGEGVVMCALQ